MERELASGALQPGMGEVYLVGGGQVTRTC